MGARPQGLMKALVVRGGMDMQVEDVVKIAYSEGKKLFHTYGNIRVPWLQYVDRISAWVVVVELEEVVAKKLEVSERASLR